MSRTNTGYFLLLLLMGAAWGLTQPLTKIAVSTGHLQFGLIVWQLVFGIAVLLAINLYRRNGLPIGRRYMLRYGVVALAGTIIPNSISYQAAVHLPSGILSILMTLVAMFSLPMALLIGLEKFQPFRLVGVLLGAAAMVLLVGPDASLPDPSLGVWVLFAAITPVMYAFENTWVSRYGVLDLDPVQVLLGASLFGLIIVVPMALGTGQWIDITQPWSEPEFALLGSSVLHVFAYAGYIWLIGRTGSVFASQVSYLVTGCGVLWAIVLLNEGYSGWVWSAMALMMVGLFLVQPRDRQA